jgi:hypothetical protein
MPTPAVENIAKRLYAASPADILFHYTSLGAMQSILKHRSIWATDIRFFSDAAELRHLMNSLHDGIRKRSENEVLSQFRDWLADRLPHGNMVFAVSFSAQGDLLSQWRAYSPPAKGVSLGFNPEAIVHVASEQSFSVGRCLYDRKEQDQIVGEVLDSVEPLAVGHGEDAHRHPTQSYHTAFETIETPLLRIGALFKHPAFREEAEWRAVSPVLTDVVHSGIQYREGASTLVPYIEFKLATLSSPLPLSSVIVGPTPHVNLASDAISRCLSGHGASPGVYPSVIPYRTW